MAGLAAVRRGEAALADFREDIRRTFGVRHVFLASSGRAALSSLLQAYHALHPDRDVVALPAYTSFSVPSAVVNAGLKVALYDVDPETLSPVPASLERVVTRQTLAVVVCHLFGYPADLDPARQAAKSQGVPVIDDAAQAMGAVYKGKPVGTCGDAGLFSLSRGKNINAVDGGVIVTDRDELAHALENCAPADSPEGTPRLFCKALLLSALIHPNLYWLPRSLPFLGIGKSVFNPSFHKALFTPFQAGIARRMLARLPTITARRLAVAGWFDARLKNMSSVTVPHPLENAEPVYLRFPVIMAEGEPVLEEPHLGIVRSYPVSLDALPELDPFWSRSAGGFYPGATLLARRLLTLPTHQFITDSDRLRIVAHMAG
jgi:dTDP-4-amino-4,6-dideoxygalactose transaminase